MILIMSATLSNTHLPHTKTIPESSFTSGLPNYTVPLHQTGIQASYTQMLA